MNPTRVLRLDTTQSTNSDATQLGREGENGPLWVVAREQSGGRGRHGRVWHSPPGNLYTSLLLVEPCAPDVAPQLGFVAGVALVAAIDDLVGQGHGGKAHVGLKWPNDLLHDGAKLTGISLDATRRSDGAFMCVIGIGVNCRSHPTGLAYPTTDLSVIAGRDIAPEDVHARLDRLMMDWLSRWDKGRRFAAIRDAWLARASHIGGPVSVAMTGKTIEGIFDTIDDTGRLVVATASGRVTIDAGDVQFGSAAKQKPEQVS